MGVRAVLGGLSHYEEATDDGRGPRFSMNRQTRKNTRMLIVPGEAAADALVNECFPPFRPPGQYPIRGYRFFVDSLDIVPMGKAREKSGSISVYDKYLATITYSPLPYEADDESSEPPILDMVERNWDFGGEFQTLPGSRMYWEDEDTPALDESLAATIQIDVISHVFTRHHLQLSDVPFRQIRLNSARVNKVDFPDDHPLFPGVKAECLKFLGAQISYRYASDGTQDYRVTYTWHERNATDTTVGEEEESEPLQLTWQHVYDSRTQKWRKLFHDEDHEKPLHRTVTIAQIESLFPQSPPVPQAITP